MFYGLVGVFGYLAFQDGVDSNILLNFPADDRVMQARGSWVATGRMFS